MTPGNGILSLSIADKQVLYSAYMPFLINGGLFISSQTSYQIGSEVFLMLRLMEDPERIAVLGKVVWVTPSRKTGRRNSGFGVQFTDRDSIAQSRIESLLAGQFDKDLMTQTL